ncbi:DNA helicase RecQ [Paratractidigestivibacter faecalis]|uniref:DNA helicase RecQ n=1 Tax=Paratractidigestivibacter faecalis TaxID=2292441 RepID=UPI003F94B2E5
MSGNNQVEKGTDWQALDVLRQTFGYESFRPHQEQIVQATLAGRDVLAVMPTSAGKSICYQVPALVLAQRGGGLTVVVSPLISLMKDQVGSLRQYGVAASYLNSTLGPSEQADVLHGVASGAVTLLYVAPERLDDPRFLEVAGSRGVALLAVDEAHCISQWGNDFRPSYQRILGFIDGLPARPAVMALTATATKAVREDIAGSLGLADPFTVVASFDRPNLSFAVEHAQGRAQKDRALLSFVRQRPERSGIVYCASRRAVEETCDLLRDAGLPATRYHAGLAAEERQRNQDDFLYDRASVMVATNAFGMGIDKSNVSYVVHYNMPSCLENYYQEAGRAGRDGTPAECLLLYSPGDVHTQEFLLSKTGEDRDDLSPEQLEQIRGHDSRRLEQMTFYSTTTNCLRAFILRYFGEEAPAYCGNCGNCLAEFEEVDATTDALKVVSCVARLAQRGRFVGASTIVDVLRGSRAEKVISRGYDTLSTYGIMEKTPVTQLRALIDELVYLGLLARTTGDYPTVVLTEAGHAFMRARSLDGRPLMTKVAKGKAHRRQEAATPGGKRRPAADLSQLDEESQALYQELCELRTQLATEQQVPPYIIFSNATLVDMCAKRPRNIDEFLDVSGVGAKKAQAYGNLFLARLNP